MAHDPPRGEFRGHGVGEGGLGREHLGDPVLAGDGGLDLRVVKLRAEQRAPLGVARIGDPRMAEMVEPVGQRRPERAPRIAGSGLDPEPLERPLAEQSAVGHAVERHATGQAEVREARLRMNVPGHSQDDLLEHLLDAGGEVHLPLGERAIGPPRRTVKQPVEPAARHLQAGAVVEESLIEPERAVVAEVDDFSQDGVGIPRITIGGESHELVLAGVHPEATEQRERAVEQAGRVRKPHLGLELDPAAPAGAPGGGAPLADAVEREDRRLVEGARVEAARGMRLVVGGEQDRPGIVAAKPLIDLPRDVEFPLQPLRHRLHEGGKAAGGEGQGRLQEPLELDQRLLVKDDGVEFGRRDAGLREAPLGRPRREGLVVLLPREPLLLGRGHDRPVANDRGGAVMEERRNAEDVHPDRPEKRSGPGARVAPGPDVTFCRDRNRSRLQTSAWASRRWRRTIWAVMATLASPSITPVVGSGTATV